MKKYLFERFSDDYKRLFNQTGVRARMAPMIGSEHTNACWDGMIAPDGRYYFPLSSEGGECGATQLAYFDYDADKVTMCFDTKDVLLSNDRMLPHSKFHTSLQAIPRHALYPEVPYDPDDYLVVGTTHSTDRAKQHSEWMPFGHHNHVWEGFPGSQILVWDPKTEHGMTLGTPVPHESIYGACYEPKRNRLYMIGFMRGHVYCYDFNERRVIKDLGKVAEIFCFRLVLGADGNIYGCTKSGQMFKIDTEKVEVENLEFHVPDFKENYKSYTWYRYMIDGRNHPSGKYMYFSICAISIIYKLEFATGKVTPVGRCIPMDGIYELPDEGGDFQPNGFAVDKDGVLWLAVVGAVTRNQTPYNFPRGTYLVRWDPENGEAPFVCGQFGKPERLHMGITELDYDEKRDRLLWACNDHRPCAGGIDLEQFRKVTGSGVLSVKIPELWNAC